MRTATLTLFGLVSSALALSPLLGVHPSQRSHFETAIQSDASSAFACLDGSKSIPATSINDDFCDCQDGSDEPGTSACNNAIFYCENVGHIGSEIPSSRVNDGVCDPQCCDGSDEYNGVVECPNVCAKAGSEFKKTQEEAKKILQKGMKVKREYLQFAATASATRALQIHELELEIWNITARIDELKVLKTEAEAYETHLNALQALQSRDEAKAALPHLLSTCTQRVQTLRSDLETLNMRVDQLTSILTHLASLRAAEEGAAFEALLRDKPILQETLQRFEDFTGQYGSATVVLEPEVVVSDQDFSSTGDAGSPSTDSLSLMDPCVDPTASTFRCVLGSTRGLFLATVAAVKYPLHWPGWKKLWLSLKNPFARLSRSEENELLRKDAQKARTRLSEMDKLKWDLDAKLEKLKKKSGMDMGPQNVWDKVVGECVDVKSFEYQYEVCFLEKAVQRPIGGGSGTDLGKFSRWGPRDSTQTTRGKYFYMMFENGAHCWNGPHRSVEVALECGAENKVLSVSEPSKCEYAMRVQTPAVCDDAGDSDLKKIMFDTSQLPDWVTTRALPAAIVIILFSPRFVAIALLVVIGFLGGLVIGGGVSLNNEDSAAVKGDMDRIEEKLATMELSTFETSGKKDEDKPLPPLPAKLETSLNRLIQYIIKDFILSWYTPLNYSKSDEFATSVHSSLHHALIHLGLAASKTKIVHAVSPITQTLTNHISEYRDFEASSLPLEIYLARNPQSPFHRYSESEGSMNRLLRRLAGHIVMSVMPKADRESPVVFGLAREILATSVLGSLVETYSDPHHINTLLIEYVKGLQKQAEEEGDGESGERVETRPVNSVKPVKSAVKNTYGDQLFLKIVEAKQLPLGQGSTFCRVFFNGNELRTDKVTSETHPIWNEDFAFDWVSVHPDEMISIEIYDGMVLRGVVSIRAKSLKPNQYVKEWFPVDTSNSRVASWAHMAQIFVELMPISIANLDDQNEAPRPVLSLDSEKDETTAEVSVAPLIQPLEPSISNVPVLAPIPIHPVIPTHGYEVEEFQSVDTLQSDLADTSPAAPVPSRDVEDPFADTAIEPESTPAVIVPPRPSAPSKPPRTATISPPPRPPYPPPTLPPRDPEPVNTAPPLPHRDAIHDDLTNVWQQDGPRIPSPVVPRSTSLKVDLISLASSSKVTSAENSATSETSGASILSPISSEIAQLKDRISTIDRNLADATNSPSTSDHLLTTKLELQSELEHLSETLRDTETESTPTINLYTATVHITDATDETIMCETSIPLPDRLLFCIEVQPAGANASGWVLTKPLSEFTLCCDALANEFSKLKKNAYPGFFLRYTTVSRIAGPDRAALASELETWVKESILSDRSMSRAFGVLDLLQPEHLKSKASLRGKKKASVVAKRRPESIGSAMGVHVLGALKSAGSVLKNVAVSTGNAMNGMSAESVVSAAAKPLSWEAKLQMKRDASLVNGGAPSRTSSLGRASPAPGGSKVAMGLPSSLATTDDECLMDARVPPPIPAREPLRRHTAASPAKEEPRTRGRSKSPVRQSAQPEQQSRPVPPPRPPAPLASEPQKKPPSSELSPSELAILLECAFGVIDEVFNLSDPNQWIRQRGLQIVKSVLRNSYSVTVSTMIQNQVDESRSMDAVVGYLDLMSDSLWPNGVWAFTTPEYLATLEAEKLNPRSEAQATDTRMEAKSLINSNAALLGYEGIQTVVGKQNTAMGLSRLFNMLQYRELNRGLICAVLEAVVRSVLADH
ncbi:hypothetical protein HDU98_006534 [Podochytrium sp. JEL0797]|nr:hypothetical protein HDU98_006534 [Podochytrium sp. JEL0797]